MLIYINFSFDFLGLDNVYFIFKITSPDIRSPCFIRYNFVCDRARLLMHVLNSTYRISTR
jgi:hypothetical protein